MNHLYPNKIMRMTKIALCASFISVLATIVIPVGIIPFSMAMVGVFITALLLKPLDACVSVVLYLLLGCVGVPIFANFSAGPQVLLGPTGGYLIGYVCVAFIISFFSHKYSKFWQTYIFMVLGLISCYIFGTVWLMIYTQQPLQSALMLGVIPFIIPDLIKAFLALTLIYKLRKIK